MGGMGGGMGGGQVPGPAQEVREVEVEATGGGTISGPLRLGPIVVDSEFGRYEIRPDKVSRIRLDPPEGGPAFAVLANGVQVVQIPGVVATTSGEEVAGTLAIPGDWRITTDLGTLTLEPAKLKSITFRPDAEGDDQANPPSGGGASRPRIERIGQTLWAISPSGHKVVVKPEGEGEPRTLELPASEEEPLAVFPVYSNFLAALNLEGDEIGRVAVYNFQNKSWYSKDLVEPVEGRATPLVSNTLAVYHLGRRIYAFSAMANRWDVLELPEGVSASPIVSNDIITVEYDGAIHTFAVHNGRWEHADARELLGIDDTKEVDAPEQP
jgi:hypothetical protein